MSMCKFGPTKNHSSSNASLALSAFSFPFHWRMIFCKVPRPSVTQSTSAALNTLRLNTLSTVPLTDIPDSIILNYITYNKFQTFYFVRLIFGHFFPHFGHFSDKKFRTLC